MEAGHRAQHGVRQVQWQVRTGSEGRVQTHAGVVHVGDHPDPVVAVEPPGLGWDVTGGEPEPEPGLATLGDVLGDHLSWPVLPVEAVGDHAVEAGQSPDLTGGRLAAFDCCRRGPQTRQSSPDRLVEVREVWCRDGARLVLQNDQRPLPVRGHVEHPGGARHIDGDGENQAGRIVLSADLERLGPVLGGQHPRDGPSDQLLGSNSQQAERVQCCGVHGAGIGLHREQGAVGLDHAQPVNGLPDAFAEVEADGRRRFGLAFRFR